MREIMRLITVDETRCNFDGICVREFPMAIITQTDEKSPAKQMLWCFNGRLSKI
jgi:hypothetical protein